MRWSILIVALVWIGITGPVVWTKFPPITSAMPAEVAVARFLDQWGWGTQWYPNWYLGVPVRGVMGPVVSGMLTIVHQVLDWSIGGDSLELWMRAGLICLILAWWLGGMGVTYLVQMISKSWRKAVLVGVMYMILPGLVWVFPWLWKESSVAVLTPWHMLGNLGFGGLRDAWRAAVLPWGLVVYRWWLGIESFQFPSFSASWRIRVDRQVSSFKLVKWGWVAVLLVVLITALIEISGMVSLGIGMLILWVVDSQEKGWAGSVRSGLFSILLLAGGLMMAMMVWYPIELLWSWWGSASLAGKPRWQVVIFLVRYLAVLIPVVLGLVCWKRFKSWTVEKKVLVLWLAIFSFLTVARWVADVDFWQDYTKWANELEIGMAWWVGMVIDARLKNIKRKPMRVVFLGLIILLSGWQVYRIREGISSLQQHGNEGDLKQKAERWFELGDKGRLFLTGTSMFWANVVYPGKLQIRGGEETVVTNKNLLDGVYQVREGEDGKLSWLWLQALGVNRILVQDESSSEFYKDFKQARKFQISSSEFKLIREGDGDYLYGVAGSGLVRLADKEILEAEKPRSGTDKERVGGYVAHLREEIDYEFLSPEEIVIEGSKGDGQVVWMAMGGGKKWKVVSSNEGESLGREERALLRQEATEGQVVTDGLGNLVIENSETGNFKYVLKYEGEKWWQKVMLGSLMAGIWFLVYRWIVKKEVQWQEALMEE